MLCIWHINKNILKNCRNKCDKHEQFDYFMKEVNQLLCISTEPLSMTLLLSSETSFQRVEELMNTHISNVVHLKNLLFQPGTIL